jgi:hypothetical protein
LGTPAGLLILLLLFAAWAPAEPAAGADGPVEQARRQAASLIEQLDSDRFDARSQALRQLKELAARPDLRPIMAEQIDRVLVLSETSFEVRQQLEQLRRELPQAKNRPAAEVSLDEVKRLIAQLEDDSFGKRLGATKRLEWLLEDPQFTFPILQRLKQRLGEDQIPADALGWLEPVYEYARGAWLASDPAQDNLPAVTTEQMTAWVDQLAAPATAGRPLPQRVEQVARRELEDLLARDKYVPQVKEVLESRLAAGDLDADATARLNAMLELTFPAMVAEFWQEGRHLNRQDLLVGVPKFYPQGASHFDRIDDRVAHCVSGVTLSPGEYPVGVAIPHPTRETALFHLVNLPTPRRRMAYEYYVKTDEATRLAQLSRRTLERLLAPKQSLSEPELVMLAQLDAQEVSRFAAEYFQLVADEPLAGEGGPQASGRPSRHGLICEILAARGTRDAADGLIRAIQRNRFLPPTATAPYRLPWIAALAISARDPWPGADDWLGTLIQRTDQLVLHRVEAPELGATAAAILLDRHRKKPSDFGLAPFVDPLLAHVGIPGYRFADEASRGQAQAWWAAKPITDREGETP